LQLLLALVMKHHVQSVQRGLLRDLGAHRPGANDGESRFH
jgi:hypothetical protein